MIGKFDVMQVCMNGHVITDTAASQPQFRKAFCAKCGERTITACPECKTAIPGEYHVSGVMILSAAIPPPPNNCANCGVAFPWRQVALASAVEILELELEGQDALDAAALIPLVAIDTPKTELAAMKLRKIMSKIKTPAYDTVVNIVSNIASETAKKALGLG